MVAALTSRRTWPMTRQTGHCHCVEGVVGVVGGHGVVWSRAETPQFSVWIYVQAS